MVGDVVGIGVTDAMRAHPFGGAPVLSPPDGPRGHVGRRRIMHPAMPAFAGRRRMNPHQHVVLNRNHSTRSDQVQGLCDQPVEFPGRKPIRPTLWVTHPISLPGTVGLRPGCFLFDLCRALPMSTITPEAAEVKRHSDTRGGRGRVSDLPALKGHCCPIVIVGETGALDVPIGCAFRFAARIYSYATPLKRQGKE